MRVDLRERATSAETLRWEHALAAELQVQLSEKSDQGEGGR